jgi:non-specific serine/threonine protein kinase
LLDSPIAIDASKAQTELGDMTHEQLEELNLRAGISEDAGEMLDADAKAAYGRRLQELREEMEEANEFHDADRADKAKDEIDALSREFTRAVGRGGRNRRAGSSSERARLSVTRAVKVAIDRIAGKHPPLAAHLRATIKTGTFCSYRPNLSNPVTWRF